MFSIAPEDLAFAPVSSTYSYGGIQDRGDMPFSIYGDVVLKNIYAIFDLVSPCIDLVLLRAAS